MKLPTVAILGAGPAGLGAAHQLRKLQRANVLVFEQHPTFGGNAGSFEFGAQRVDYGSHRLHPACDPMILADIRALLGNDLLDRPRHGRIGLRNRWIHFPLKPADLLMKLDKTFAMGALRDMILKPMRRRSAGLSFADVLSDSLGPTICEHFYFPFAWKMWGRSPRELSGIQARRRVSAASFSKLFRKVLSAVPGFKPAGAGRFYYPRHGYGQISEAYARAAQDTGASIHLNSSVRKLTPPTSENPQWQITVESPSGIVTQSADYIWSTIPISALPNLIEAPISPEVASSLAGVSYRSMILVYLQLPMSQYTEFDAHYLPSQDIHITRLSEPKNYSDLLQPRETTVLCAELPCSQNDPCWSMTDAELGDLVIGDLLRAGLPSVPQPLSIATRRLKQAYPIYVSDYELSLRTLEKWLEQFPSLLSFGRQGLFAHDNTHHALAMAHAAVDCLGPNGFESTKWGTYRKIFESHVVED